MKENTCRFCKHPLKHTFVDLGMSPLSNSFIKAENLQDRESFYPLHTYVCDQCFLVQLEEFVSPETIFSDYVYFSSYSDSWLNHAREYAAMMLSRFQLNSKSQILEIASNDGYLLQYFQQKDIPVLGVEPAANVAKEAEKKGIPTVVDFWGQRLAHELSSQGKQADVLIGNNVLAHVPDINDFVAGMKILLKPHGVITMEFPHLLRLMQFNQFDTIYHEHFSYLSFSAVQNIFFRHKLELFDVEELTTHGGSIRIYACHAEDKGQSKSIRVTDMLTKEQEYGLKNISCYQRFAEQVKETKRNILAFMIQAKQTGKTIVGYGAPAKGNTLLNYCGIRTDFLEYTVDRSPHKQGLYLPGMRIPVKSPDTIKETKPDYVLILPWNLSEEIITQMAYIRDWGGKFIIPIPTVKVIE